VRDRHARTRAGEHESRHWLVAPSVRLILARRAPGGAAGSVSRGGGVMDGVPRSLCPGVSDAVGRVGAVERSFSGRLLYMSSPLVSPPVVTATATIVGTIVGAVATYTAQRSQWKRQYETRWDEAKKIAYAALFTTCNQWWRSIHWYFDTVGEVRNRYLEITGEVSILAEESTRQAAQSLTDYLGNLQESFSEDGWPSGYDIEAERANFVALREAYREAVRKELFAPGRTKQTRNARPPQLLTVESAT
jgi:hypothetical protein